MATPIQSIKVRTITATEVISGANTISILNGSANALTISADGGTNTISLTTGQSVSMSASTGFVLPDIRLTGTAMSAQIIQS
jgi:hypothetical protein